MVTDETLQLSDVVGVPRDTPMAVHVVCDAYVVMSAGQVMCGRTVSYTLTVCLHVMLLPDASVVVHVTVVAPEG